MEATQTNTINNAHITFIAKLFYVNDELVKLVYNDVINNTYDKNNMKNVISLLNHFGNVSINLIHNQNILSDHVFTLSKPVALTIINLSSSLILRNKTDTINNMLLDTALSLFVSTRQDIEIVLNNIYSCITSYAGDIADRFSKDITNLNGFLEMRNDYYTQTAILGRTLTLISDVVKIAQLTKDNKMSKISLSIFKTMRDYAFYEKVIAHKYTLPDILKKDTQSKKETHLFGVLTNIIDKSDKSQIEAVFKLINMFNGFSYSIIDKGERNKIFLEEIDTEGKQPIIDKNVMNEFMKQIDNNIRKLFVYSSEAKYKTLTVEITDQIHMCQKISDPKVFIELYSQYLQKRLLDLQMDDSVDIDKLVTVETNLAKLLKYDTSSISSQDTYIKIMMMMNDIRGCDFVNREFRNIPVRFDGDKYPKTFQDTFDRSLTDFMIIRKNVWDGITYDTDKVERINEPDFIKYYLNMFYDFYNKYFKLTTNKAINGSDRRKIRYIYDNSITDMSYEIGEMTYLIRSNVIQASILSYIIDNPNITAEELSNKMNYKLRDMFHCINSLLLSGLIIRKIPNQDNGNTDNTNIKIQFTINPLFKSDSKIINLLEFIDNAIIEHNKACEERKQKEHEMYMNGIKNHIVEIVKVDNNISQTNIIQKLRSINNYNNVDPKIVGDALNLAILSGDIVPNQNSQNETCYSPISMSKETIPKKSFHSEEETVELTADDIKKMTVKSTNVSNCDIDNSKEKETSSNKSRSKSGSNAKSKSESESESESDDTEVYSDITDDDNNDSKTLSSVDEHINKLYEQYENLEAQLSKYPITRNMSIEQRLKVTKERSKIEAAKVELLEILEKWNKQKC